jgi:hypothetical protein
LNVLLIVVVVAAATNQSRPLLIQSQTCPFLLRVYHKIGSHHRPEEFSFQEPSKLAGSAVIHTW